MKGWEYGVTAACWSFVAIVLFGGWAAVIVTACTPAQKRDAGITVKEIEPVIAGAVCQLAADQGQAEPGWEILACSVLEDGRQVTLKLPRDVADGAIEHQYRHLSPYPNAPPVRRHLDAEGH